MSEATEIRVRGRVQGVGFRPTVWRLANDLHLSGEVSNDGEGVVIRVLGDAEAVARLIGRLRDDAPPLARIDAVETRAIVAGLGPGFRIVASGGGSARTEVAPDAALCTACAAEIFDPHDRRYRYPFATCTNCGPRFSIATGIPYDRATTTMAAFPLCPQCRTEYEDPRDRRFHAEATACHACGPRARLIRTGGGAATFESFSLLDDCDAACTLLQRGSIVAIKGLGGYQLACDATNAAAVATLRERKRRDRKPFALMARDLDVIRRYASPSAEEERLLSAPEAPIVLLRANGAALPEPIAPGLTTLGFMLPTTPLHALVLRRMEQPVVMTSGNLSEEPQVIEDAEMLRRLGAIAEFALVHDRQIATRLDDSVVRVVAAQPRMLRRGRGYAPGTLPLPAGFETAPPVLAYGGELKTTFCLTAGGRAILSQHLGDLQEQRTFEDYRRNLEHLAVLFAHTPAVLAADLHPEYRSTLLARERANASGLPLIEVQHHHAHIASVLAENGRALEADPVIGIALDGLGYGSDGSLWGGEFLLADYRHARRIGTLKPVALPGGDAAAREPWRNLYAHVTAEMSWVELTMNFARLELYRDLEARPRAAIDGMMRSGVNSPKASSCGRLFDAVAAALGICPERQAYEGEAAMRLEALVCEETLRDEDESPAYPFAIALLPGTQLPYLEPLAMWRALLRDLVQDTPAPVVAARFHKGLAAALAAMALELRGKIREDHELDVATVALSGGCFQNKVLLEESSARLRAEGFTVLTQHAIPANDGGIALGQAAVAAALSL